MNEHQEIVKRFVQQHRLECSVEARLLDLVSQLGEVSKELLKSTNYGIDPFAQTAQFGEELGDVYFSLLALAYAAHVDLDQVLQQAMDKYATRLRENSCAGSGL